MSKPKKLTEGHSSGPQAYWDSVSDAKIEMSKNVTYDFGLDSIVAVDAPIGTDPDTLIEQVKEKLIQRIREDDVTIVFENIYDSETGAYDEDWENYERDL